MEAKRLMGMINRLKPLAERAIQAHRGDGVAEPALELCNALLAVDEPEEPPKKAPRSKPKK